MSPAGERLRLDRLVAHRELQLVRAEASGHGDWIAVRRRKLEEARSALARLEERQAA